MPRCYYLLENEVKLDLHSAVAVEGVAMSMEAEEVDTKMIQYAVVQVMKAAVEATWTTKKAL